MTENHENRTIFSAPRILWTIPIPIPIPGYLTIPKSGYTHTHYFRPYPYPYPYPLEISYPNQLYAEKKHALLWRSPCRWLWDRRCAAGPTTSTPNRCAPPRTPPGCRRAARGPSASLAASPGQCGTRGCAEIGIPSVYIFFGHFLRKNKNFSKTTADWLKVATDSCSQRFRESFG